MDNLLEMNDICKSYGGNLVLNRVSLNIAKGEILAFLGENGAGKSTLIKILAGIVKKDAGEIRLEDHGNIENTQSVTTAGCHPVSFIHQDLGLIEWMTITENIAYSIGYKRKARFFIDWKASHTQIEKILALVGLDVSPKTRIFNLSQAEKSIVAIARALAVDAKLLVLDEPTATLPINDVRKLFDIMESLKKKGVSMLYVTHRLDEVIEIADRALVIRDGNVVNDKKVDELDIQTIVQDIVGEKVTDDQYRAAVVPSSEPVVLDVKNLVISNNEKISFELRRGECLGLVGLRGAGHEQVGRCIFGTIHKNEGSIILHKKELRNENPYQSIKSGISLVAGNRIREGLVTTMGVNENTFLNKQNHRMKALQFYTLKSEYKDTTKYIDLLHIKPHDPRVDITSLSGGNQQKVIIGRWFDIDNDVLILEDPTAGVDVGARSEFYKQFLEILRQGKSLILISNDFDEIQKVCPRVLVFNKGKVKAELKGEEVNHENIFRMSSS